MMGKNSQFETKALKVARERAVYQLIALGADIKVSASTTTVAKRLKMRGFMPAYSQEPNTDYFTRFCEAHSHKPTREPVKFEPLKTVPHLRADEIDALPNQVSMGWDGKMGKGYASWGNGAW